MANRTYHPRGVLVDGLRVEQHPLYRCWASMLSRCLAPNSTSYHNYGGRGITVCDRWLHFANFAADMGLKPHPDLTLERMNNAEGYSPDNCRWETGSNQCVNRRTFKSNTSGHTGVLRRGGSWIARFDYEGLRYNIGWFATKDEAVSARVTFVELFFFDRDAAVAMLPKDKARHTSKTGHRGVTPHADGGFTARVTVLGVRHYLGYFKTEKEAFDARSKFIAG